VNAVSSAELHVPAKKGKNRAHPCIACTVVCARHQHVYTCTKHIQNGMAWDHEGFKFA
jgi:hypothetical protein